MTPEFIGFKDFEIVDIRSVSRIKKGKDDDGNYYIRFAEWRTKTDVFWDFGQQEGERDLVFQFLIERCDLEIDLITEDEIKEYVEELNEEIE